MTKKRGVSKVFAGIAQSNGANSMNLHIYYTLRSLRAVQDIPTLHEVCRDHYSTLCALQSHAGAVRTMGVFMLVVWAFAFRPFLKTLMMMVVKMTRIRRRTRAVKMIFIVVFCVCSAQDSESLRSQTCQF